MAIDDNAQTSLAAPPSSTIPIYTIFSLWILAAVASNTRQAVVVEKSGSEGPGSGGERGEGGSDKYLTLFPELLCLYPRRTIYPESRFLGRLV